MAPDPARLPAPGPAAPGAARGQLNIVDGLAQLAFVIHGMLELRAAEHDLSITQARLLGVLRDRTPTMNELARLLELDKSSVSGLVDRAERRGLVVRIPSAEDKRAVLVRLTDLGQSLLSRAAACFGADLTAMLDLVPSSDRDALSAIVSRMLVAYAADHGADLFAGPDTDLPTAAPKVQSFRPSENFPPLQTAHRRSAPCSGIAGG